MKPQEFITEAVNPDILEALKNLGYKNVSVSGNQIKVMVELPKGKNAQLRTNVLQQILLNFRKVDKRLKLVPYHNTEGTVLAKSSIGAVAFENDPSYIIVKDLSKQGDSSAGVGNEHELVRLMQEQINKYKTVNVTFFDKRGKSLTMPKVFEIEHTGTVGGRRTGGKNIAKADVILISVDQHKLPVSIKQLNAGFWESADTLFRERGSAILQKLLKSGEIWLTEDPPKSGNYKLPFSVVIDPTEEEALTTLFGSDINPEGGIIIQDFQAHHFTQNKNNVKIECSAVIKNKDDVPESHLMVWRLRNAAGRAPLGIRGIRPEAATLKTAVGLTGSRDVLRVDVNGNVIRRPVGISKPAKPIAKSKK